MGNKTNIEWTDATWNPWHGCHKISQGCKHCYMFRDKERFGQDPNIVTRSSKTTFYSPLRWKEPRRIFTCSWSDFFIEEADEWRDEAFALMALTPQHTYQVLTKRPERMLEYFNADGGFGPWGRVETIGKRIMRKRFKWSAEDLAGKTLANYGGSNLPNVWLGVSIEDQKTADERIPYLLQTPAAVRFLSIEPLLGPVDLGHEWGAYQDGNNSPLRKKWLNGIGWAIVGGESGPGARRMQPEWVRTIRDQCKEAGVPFFFKQGSQANWPKFKDFDVFPKDFQIREFPNSLGTRR